MVFELAQLKIANLLRSTRRLGSRMHRMLDKALEAEGRFKEHFESLSKSIEEGDAEKVKYFFDQEVKDVLAAADAIITAEETDVLYTHEINREIKKEEKAVRDTYSRILHLNIAPELFHDKKALELMGKRGIRNADDLKRHLIKEYKRVAGELDTKVHDRIQQAISLMEAKSKHQRWGERLSDLMGAAGFMKEYEAFQASRGMRWEYRDLSKHLEEAENDLKKTGSIIEKGISKTEDLENLLESIGRLEKEIKDEESEFSKMLKRAVLYYNFCVFEFFKAMAEYEKLVDQIEHLQEQRFPEEQLQKMRKAVQDLQDHVRYNTLEERRVISEVRGRA